MMEIIKELSLILIQVLINSNLDHSKIQVHIFGTLQSPI